jgi:hypothetical protein
MMNLIFDLIIKQNDDKAAQGSGRHFEIGSRAHFDRELIDA